MGNVLNYCFNIYIVITEYWTPDTKYLVENYLFEYISLYGAHKLPINIRHSFRVCSFDSANVQLVSYPHNESV